MNKMKFYGRLLCVIFLGIWLVACGRATPPPPEEGQQPPLQEEEEIPAPPVPEVDPKEEKIKEVLEAMTLEEKVAQVFMVAFRKDEKGSPILRLDQRIKEVLAQYPVGGVVLFSENIDTLEQTLDLIQSFQEESRIPLFIGVDEEGGKVSRLHTSGKIPATKLPGNAVIGQAGDPDLAYGIGKLLGEELGAMGFTLNFAPVADVNTNPQNPVIGNRSFGEDPQLVAEMVGAMVRGLQDQNISAVLKHYPGHGDTAQDTHREATSVSHDLERLKTVEFLPFAEGIAQGADGVMTAHIQVPQVTGNQLPATLSKELMGLLRNTLGHEKLIFTDALDMAAISNHWSSREAAVMAFEAGADVLLMPVSLPEAYEGLLEAVKTGRIPEERLEASVTRILSVKYDRGLWERKEPVDPKGVLGSPEHQQLVQQLKEKAKGGR